MTSVVISSWANEVAITMDNPNTYEWPMLTSLERDSKIRSTLKENNLKIMLFVAGNEVDSVEGKKLLKIWDEEGYIIGNHS